MRRWLGRARALFSRRRLEAELSDELTFHLAMQAKKHLDAGMSAHDAETLARREFGNIELTKEDARDVRGMRPLEETLQDMRYASRVYLRAPALAASLVVTIGLGVGISASAFTVFNAYVLRPFDVRDPASLYSMNWMDRAGHHHDFSRQEFDELRRSKTGLADVIAFRSFGLRLGASAASGDAVSENYFAMLGVRPAVGRTLVDADASQRVVVLSYAAWLTRFAGDSAIIGRRILLRGEPFQVVGIVQRGFAGLFKKPRDFWVPLDAMRSSDSAATRSDAERDLSLIGRLRPAVSVSQGRAVVASLLQSTTAGRPDSGRVSLVFFESRESPIPHTVGSYAAFTPLVLSFGLILLLACANVANVLLARGLERRRELGIRLALGAARARLVRQLVTESIVVILPAAGVGFGLAWVIVDVGVRALFATMPADLAPFIRFVPLAPDWRVVTFAVVATMASALVCGLAPSLRATRLSVVQATRGMFDQTGSPRRDRGTLIVGQVAVSALLLITAGILVRQASRLGRVHTGLRTDDVVSVEPEAKSRATVLAALRSNPIVDMLASSTALPLDMKFPPIVVTVDSTSVEMVYNRVSAAYFDVLGIGIVGGRAFTRADEDGALAAVVLSESAARRLWPRANPLGRIVRVRPREASDSMARYQSARVVGIARNVVVGSLDAGTDPAVLYFANRIQAEGCCLLARVRGGPDAAKRTLGLALDDAVPGGVERVDRLETFVAGAIYPFRVAYWVALGLGLVALALTVVGIYGVVSYLVEQRTREIGIRIALGATRGNVLALVMRQAVRQAVIGTLVGSALAVGLGRLIAADVQAVPAFDLLALVLASSTVFAACGFAALLPSRRASAVDPTTALRYD